MEKLSFPSSVEQILPGFWETNGEMIKEKSGLTGPTLAPSLPTHPAYSDFAKTKITASKENLQPSLQYLLPYSKKNLHRN